MITKIDSRLQEAAIVLAEELHFGHAAQRLHVAVSTLSKQIAQLEEKLGATLFERNSKKVRVTDAGRAYVEHVRTSVLEGERAVLMARAAKEGIDHMMVVGHSPYLDSAFTSLLLSIRLPLYPNLQIQLQSDFVLNLIHRLLTAQLDMALVVWPPDDQKLTLVPILTTALYVLLPDDHPAAGQSQLSLTDLGGGPWLLFNKQAHPLLYDRILGRAEALGIRPRESHRFVTPHEAFHLVAEHTGVAFLSKAAAQCHRHTGVVARPLADDALQLSTYLALRADEPSRMTNEFARAFLRKCGSANGDVQMKLPISL